MQIKPVINEKYTELELHVCKDRADSELRQMLQMLHTMLDYRISATDDRGDRVSLIPGEIIAFFAENQRVYAIGLNKRYVTSKKLFELEEELKNACFVRISKSEIINYKMIKCLDMSVTGTIKIIMKTGYETYTSRRNVAKIKELLVKEETK